MVRRGQIEVADVAQLPSNVVVRLVGVAETVEVDVVIEAVEPADIYVLASDGFYNTVGEGLLVSTIQAHSHDLPKCVEALLAEATVNGGRRRKSESPEEDLSRGGRDDLTVVVACASGDGTLDTAADGPARHREDGRPSTTRERAPLRRCRLAHLRDSREPNQSAPPTSISAANGIVVRRRWSRAARRGQGGW